MPPTPRVPDPERRTTVSKTAAWSACALLMKHGGVDSVTARRLLAGAALARTKHRFDAEPARLAAEIKLAKESLKAADVLREAARAYEIPGASSFSRARADELRKEASEIASDETDFLEWAEAAAKRHPRTLGNPNDGGRPQKTATQLWVMTMALVWEDITSQRATAYYDQTRDAHFVLTPFIAFLLVAGASFEGDHRSPRLEIPAPFYSGEEETVDPHTPRISANLVRRALKEYRKVKKGEPSAFRRIDPLEPTELMALAYGFEKRQ